MYGDVVEVFAETDTAMFHSWFMLYAARISWYLCGSLNKSVIGYPGHGCQRPTLQPHLIVSNKHLSACEDRYD